MTHEGPLRATTSLCKTSKPIFLNIVYDRGRNIVRFRDSVIGVKETLVLSEGILGVLKLKVKKISG